MSRSLSGTYYSITCWIQAPARIISDLVLTHQKGETTLDEGFRPAVSPTDAVETTALPGKSLMIGESRSWINLCLMFS